MVNIKKIYVFGYEHLIDWINKIIIRAWNWIISMNYGQNGKNGHFMTIFIDLIHSFMGVQRSISGHKAQNHMLYLDHFFFQWKRAIFWVFKSIKLEKNFRSIKIWPYGFEELEKVILILKKKTNGQNTADGFEHSGLKQIVRHPLSYVSDQ